MEPSVPTAAVTLTDNADTAPVFTLSKRPLKSRGSKASRCHRTDRGLMEKPDKPKQTKSRNGCHTCKKKRLKCDETQPTCQQCEKRKVTCEGYKKDLKWRPMEAPGTTSRTKKVSTGSKGPSFNGSDGLQEHIQAVDTTKSYQKVTMEPLWKQATGAFVPDDEHRPPPAYQDRRNSPQPVDDTYFHALTDPTSDGFQNLDSVSHSAHISQQSLPAAAGAEVYGPFDNDTASDFASQQPRDLASLHEDGTDMDNVLETHLPSQYDMLSMTIPEDFAGHDLLMDVDEDIDGEVIRNMTNSPSVNHRTLVVQGPVQYRSPMRSPTQHLVPRAIQPDGSELLLRHFDEHTCGILSVKNGPSENPWRKLVWPLAQESPALYHALFGMTAFHGVGFKRDLNLQDVALDHVNKSMRTLVSGLQKMPADAALATSLTLALSEGWDLSKSTGIEHLKGAKTLVSKAINAHADRRQLGRSTAEEAARLKFLCNTFVYCDIIARLTSNVDAHNLNIEDILQAVNSPSGNVIEIDPLMGCATTLFPLIGRVANLIQKVRNTKSNSLKIIEEASGLMKQLEQWQVPNIDSIEPPEDIQSEVQHSIQTAKAYQLATMLYLHQAVPEVPSPSSAVLAKQVLTLLSAIPFSSSTVIVHIFPLFAAGCEATEVDDREWVKSRWTKMINRLRIHNVDSCWMVLREVWQRRDLFEAEKAKQASRRFSQRGMSASEVMTSSNTASSSTPLLSRRATETSLPGDQIEAEYTVRGKLHWLQVMAGWKWEVFLG